MKTFSFVAFTFLVLFLVHTPTSINGNLFFGEDPTTTPSSTSTTSAPVVSLPASYVKSQSANQMSALPQTTRVVDNLSPSVTYAEQQNVRLPPDQKTLPTTAVSKNPLLVLLESLFGSPESSKPAPTQVDPQGTVRALSSNRLLLVLLIPLLATPFVPAALVPLLILTSTFAIFVQQFGRLSSANRLIDFTLNALSLEPQFFSLESNRHSNVDLSLATLYDFWVALYRRLYALTSLRGLQLLTQRTLDYFGASQPICQQRMVCEAAYSVATRMPAGFGNLVRSATGFMFTRINNNDLFRAWLVGLTNDNCTVTYQSCTNSPFRNMLHNL